MFLLYPTSIQTSLSFLYIFQKKLFKLKMRKIELQITSFSICLWIPYFFGEFGQLLLNLAWFSLVFGKLMRFINHFNTLNWIIKSQKNLDYLKNLPFVLGCNECVTAFLSSKGCIVLVDKSFVQDFFS